MTAGYLRPYRPTSYPVRFVSQGLTAWVGMIALPEPLRNGDEPLRDTNDAAASNRLTRVMAYAVDRSDFLDIRQDVANAAAAFDIGPVLDDAVANERADAILAAAREAQIRTLVRRLDDPTYRAGLAAALVGLVLP